jgi:G3E family GTPase
MTGKKIPTVLLCGFLGAGKTTLLSYLAQHKELEGKKIAVLVNEFGKLHIDAALLPKGDYYVSEINKGSIFCVCVKTDLLNSLKQIAEEIKPDILLIESTGVAEPSDFNSLLQTDFLQTSYEKASTICVVDAVNFLKLVNVLKALSAQLQLADLVLLNKTDLADEDSLKDVEEKIKEINPSAEIYRTVKCEFPFILSEKAGADQANASDFQLCGAPPENTFSCELRTEKAVSKKEFYEFMEGFRNIILRGKGIVDFGEEKLFVEIINGVLTSRPSSGIDLGMESGTGMSFVLRNMTGMEFNHKFSGILG